MVTLRDLKIGETARIAALPKNEAFAARLLSFGFASGEKIICLLCAPGGNPRAYAVRGGTVVLRNGDAEGVLLDIEY